MKSTKSVASTLRKEVEAEMAQEQRDQQKAQIKTLLRKKIQLEQSAVAQTEKTQKELEKIDQQIEAIDQQIEAIENGKQACYTLKKQYQFLDDPANGYRRRANGDWESSEGVIYAYRKDVEVL
jgi:hypothetical protein